MNDDEVEKILLWFWVSNFLFGRFPLLEDNNNTCNDYWLHCPSCQECLFFFNSLAIIIQYKNSFLLFSYSFKSLFSNFF